EGYYSSLNLVDFDIPTKYEELEYIIRISHIMLQVKVSEYRSLQSTETEGL
ncbi:21036_t:CDS:2, partial [Rhizophagus irregularis]